MEVIHGLEAFPQQRAPVVLALGTFDGVHRGHQAIIAQAVRQARELNGRCAVFTFDPHPTTVLNPSSEQALLTTLRERLEFFAAHGADLAVVVRFDATFRQTSAEDWVRALVTRTRMAAIVCGPTYHFGRDRRGTIAMLRDVSSQYGFRVWGTDPVTVDGAPVSSTRVREALRGGRVDVAAKLLGRWYALGGPVVRGDGRGRVLGFPTANLATSSDKLIPAPGIYAGYARTPDGLYQTAVSIGWRPTFGYGPLVVEAFLLNFSGTLYEQSLIVHLAARLRDEEAFPSAEELVRQMHNDIAAVPPALAAADQRAQTEGWSAVSVPGR